MQEDNSLSVSDLVSRIDELEKLVREIRTLVGPFGTLFPDGSMLVQTIHGIKYYIDPTDEIMAPQLVIYRQWEADLSAYMANSVNSNTIFLDVGANFGYFTCLVASRIGIQGAGRVIAVEPNPLMQQLLRRNIKVNWSMAPVEIFDGAMADKEGYVEFSVPKGRAANASLATAIRADSDERFIVKSSTIDKLAAGRIVDILKIDVEGFESLVISGAKNTIEISPDINIVIEWSLDQMRVAGYFPADLMSLFKKLNLSVFQLPPTKFISNSEWEKYRIPDENLSSMTYDNVLLRRSN